MPKLTHLGIACLSLSLYSPLHATTVMRCSDSQGHITYTLHGCPETSQKSLQRSYSPSPGRAIPVPASRTQQRKAPTPTTPTIAGTQQDGCGNILSSRERRSAIIQQRVRNGMSEKDVISSLGKPERITHNNEQTRYYYSDNQGNRRQVSFINGCVAQRKNAR